MNNSKQTIGQTGESYSLANIKLSFAKYFYGGVCISGIYTFFLIFGYCQERIFLLKLEESQEPYIYSNFLLFCLCLSNTFSSFLGLVYTKQGLALKSILPSTTKKESNENKTIFFIFLASSTYVTSMACTTFALTQVNFPTQVLVKSGKMVLVIIGSWVVFGKRYPWYDYLTVAVVTASLVCFNMSKMRKGHDPSETSSTIKGLLLLFASLVCDGLTGPLQDRINTLVKLSSIQLMFWMNLFGSIYSAFLVIMTEGNLPFQFLRQSNQYSRWLLLYSLSGTLGQFFIFLSLTMFGSLYTSLFTTLRKATSTLLSIYFFSHKLNTIQWSSITTIFTTLFAHTYFSHKFNQSNKKKGK